MSEFNSKFPLTWSNWDDHPESSEPTRSKEHRGRSDSEESTETSSSDMDSGENNGTWKESSEDNSTHWESTERNSSETDRTSRHGSEEDDGRDSARNVSAGGNSSAEDTGGWRLPGNTTHSWCVSVRKTLWRKDECLHNKFSHVCELSNVANATDGLALDNYSGNLLSKTVVLTSHASQCHLDARAPVVLLSWYPP